MRTALLIAIAIMSSDTAASEDVLCLAKNIYFEAGNQPIVGKMAVAEVVLNRVEMEQYPDTVCGVIYQAQERINWKGNKVPVLHKCQFSWYCDGKPDTPYDTATWLESVNIAHTYVEQSKYFRLYDVTEGATHYHSDSVHPYWADSLHRTVTIDNHLFYK
jgi:spore germination cell wall hydrolase CwlJ-like protein|tara:strand:+ start:1872 stop:2351 length:480 start_codon:yes stop_codon:yes gene_type:complete